MSAERAFVCAALSPLSVVPPNFAKAIAAISLIVSFETSPSSAGCGGTHHHDGSTGG